MRRVAITGFGVVSPIGSDKRTFWDSLRNGRSGIDRITRFDCSTFAVQLAGEVKDDPPLPQEVAEVYSYEPKVGFAFAAFTEAMNDAGIKCLGSDSLIHLGTSIQNFDMGNLVNDGKIDLKNTLHLSTRGGRYSIQIPLDLATRLICDAYGQPGQSLTNCSACAASLQAIGHGFNCLRTGRYDLAVCGGFDSLITPVLVGGFQLLGALTTENKYGACASRPFDAARSGAVLGEGAAVVVMEPLERALAEGKSILAEVCGYGSTLDAYGLSAPDPEGDGAVRAMTSALDDAGIGPERIEHINTHGTGTRLNDQIEALAIRKVFDGYWQKIPVSSTKSMTGHLIGATGSLEVGACLMTLIEGVMPPNPSLEKVGQGCELNHIVGDAKEFNGEYVLSNSFGFGGQNATLVLRRYNGE